MFQWHAKVFSKASPNVSSAQRSPWARLHARDLPTAAAPPVCLPASASDWHCLALLHMFIEAIWLIDSPYAVTNIYILQYYYYCYYYYCHYYVPIYCNSILQLLQCIILYIYDYICVYYFLHYIHCVIIVYHIITQCIICIIIYIYIYIYWIILVHYRNYK